MVFVPERWDVGLWDQAHWDGQLGLDAIQAAVTITAPPVAFRIGRAVRAAAAPVLVTGYPALLVKTGSFGLAADKASIAVTAPSTGLRAARRLAAAAAPALVTTYPANLVYRASYRLGVDTSAIVVTGYPVDLIYVPAETTYRMTVESGSIVVLGKEADLFWLQKIPPGALNFGRRVIAIPNRW
jgi:hypothetical protein